MAEKRTKIGDVRYKEGKTPAGKPYYASKNTTTGTKHVEVKAKKATYSKTKNADGSRSRGIEDTGHATNRGFKRAVTNWDKRGNKMPKGK